MTLNNGQWCEPDCWKFVHARELGGEVLDLSASSVVSYTNPATLVPSPMPILPAIGILGNSDTLDEAKDKEKAKAVEEGSTKKTASESKPEPTGIPVASR